MSVSCEPWITFAPISFRDSNRICRPEPRAEAVRAENIKPVLIIFAQAGLKIRQREVKRFEIPVLLFVLVVVLILELTPASRTRTKFG
ncbi:MAG: hypothetical protein RL616_2437 [Verrucomicrobiota bacterium]